MRYLFILSSALLFFLGARACGSTASSASRVLREEPKMLSDEPKTDDGVPVTGYRAISDKFRKQGAFDNVGSFMNVTRENPTDFMKYVSDDLYKALIKTGGIYRSGYPSKFTPTTLDGSNLEGIESGSYEFSDKSSHVEYAFKEFCNSDNVCIQGNLVAVRSDIKSDEVKLYDGEYLKIYLKDKKSEIESAVSVSALSASGFKNCEYWRKGDNATEDSPPQDELIIANKTDNNYLVGIAFNDIIYGSDNKVKSGKVILWTRGDCHNEIVFDVTKGGVQVTKGGVQVGKEVVSHNLSILDLSEANKRN